MKIKFIHNWNGKLDNDIFTTIRRYDPEKLVYYLGQVGEMFEVVLNGKYLNRRELFSVCRIKFGNIPLALLFLDTGTTDEGKVLSIFRQFGITEDTDVIILCFRRNNDR